MTPHILVYGADGWIGTQFTPLLEGAQIQHTKGTSRVDSVSDVEQEIKSVAPTHVVCFIGRTHGKIDNTDYPTIDYLEQPGKLTENIRDNLFAPITLAITCASLGVHCTYLGTGCIFTYDDQHGVNTNMGFDEDALPNFFGSGYSTVKGFTDRLMRCFSSTCLNLRIRMPIIADTGPRNFITKITSYDRICSIPNSMSVLPTLLPLVVDMMLKGTTGTVNLTNPGCISHNEILTMYKEIVDPTFTWNNFSQEEQRKILASDRSNNLLDTRRLLELYPDVPDIHTAVRSCLQKYPKPLNGGIDETYIPHNILVTGGCGFIGSHFINYLLDTHPDLRIINIDAMYYCADKNNISEAHRNSSIGNYVFVRGNINDGILVSHILATHDIDTVVHFAAQSHVQNSFSDSTLFSRDNVMGTNTLVECVRQYGKVLKFIHVSTDEVYGESMSHIEETRKTEHSILCPTNPYAATKAGAELIAQSYQHSFGLPLIITRGNNVYGPNQYPEKLIPRFIKLLRQGKKVTIQGTGETRRAFMYIDDAVRAFELILLRGRIGEIYNIGCDDGMEYSVMDIAHHLINKMPPPLESPNGETSNKTVSDWIEYVEDRPFNDMRYHISNNKLKELGWKQHISLEDGIERLLRHSVQ
jgi:dTDP-glucose 4,6-dehydratase